MIPTTLEEAVEQLLTQMSAAEKVAYMKESQDYPGVRFHFSTGMAMRNEWGLWHGKTGISRYLREHRIYHGDDQGLTIFRALWRRLHGLPIDATWLITQAAYYEAFWARHGLTWDQKPIAGFKEPQSWTLKVKDGRVIEETRNE